MASRSYLALVLAAVLAGEAALAADDTGLFRTNVPPNIMIIADNSGSMSNLVWHPDYGPNKNQTQCTDFRDALGTQTLKYYPAWGLLPSDKAIDLGINPTTLEFSSTANICGISPGAGWTLPRGDDNQPTSSGYTTQYDPQYLDFLFSTVGANARAAVFSPTPANGGRRYYSQCLGEPVGATYDIHRRTRTQALKVILRTVVCEINQENVVRFGLSLFRTSGSGWDPNGGFAVLPINNFKQADGSPNVYSLHGETASHGEHLARVIGSIGPDSYTPLSETLFQVYTYFMSRQGDKLPKGRDQAGNETSVKFPVYSYNADPPCQPGLATCSSDNVGGLYLTTSGGNANAAAPPSPVQYSCQKNFVLLITDGDSYQDDFNPSSPTTTAWGFSDFEDDLIGDHFADGEDECCYDSTGASNNSSSGTRYLDDIAYFMNKWDFLPDENDFPGDQTIDVYTVGFALENSSAAAASLAKTAANGNGLYFESSDADDLAADIVKAINDMINKAQSFTSATVPASRTSDGNTFYSSYFVPRTDTPFWDGHLKAFKYTQSGEILTADDKCAIGPDAAAVPPCPTYGQLRNSAIPVWDASAAMPNPNSRNLLMGKPDTAIFTSPPDWDGVTRFDLGIETGDFVFDPYASIVVPSDSDDVNKDRIAVAIRNNIKGCVFNTDCTTRTLENGDKSLLGDIFHSNPVVVGSPNSAINVPSYGMFRNLYRQRTRVMYAGSNDGFLHGFHAGDWVSTPSPPAPPGHDRGTGVELFGFMPSYIVKSIKNFRIDNTVPRAYYSVDGSPTAADVWFYRIAGGSTLGATNTLLTHETTDDEQRWRTILMGGLRQGGRSYYALDITDPSSADYPGYLWDFPCGTDSTTCSGAENDDTWEYASHMGGTWSEPIITRVRVNVASGTDPRGYERWVAIFGGGYSEAGDPNSLNYDDTGANPQGRAIIMLDLTTGKVLAAKTFGGTTSAPASSPFPEMRYAIPSSPAVFDLDFNGFADVIYIGDLGGNIWKWVVRAKGDDVGVDPDQPNWPFGLFFQARTSVGQPDPSSSSWASSTHYNSFFYPPTGVLRSGQQLLLALGSGERANPTAWENDGDPDNNNRLYAIRDVDPWERTTSSSSTATPVGTLKPYLREMNELMDAATMTPNCASLSGSSSGYYVIAEDSEKFVTNSVIFGGILLTGSFIPTDPSGADLCDTSGESYLYALGIDCGNGLYTPANGHTENTTTESQRHNSVGSGLPTRPQISVGDLHRDKDDPDPDPPDKRTRVSTTTSDGDGGNDPDLLPTPESSGIDVRTWRER